MSSNTIQYSWPGWETVGILGKGGFGAVYEIRRQIFDSTEQAAMKVISIPQSEGEITELYNDGYTKESIATVYKSHLKRIVDEYSVMRMLNGYPNIVSCDDVRYEPHEDGIGWDIYIKMELLTPLAKALPQQIPEAMVIKIATDLCKALEACQEHKLLHRDIKPQNIFVAPDGTYKLGDFGIAKTIEKTTGGTKIGTYRYMAPEIYNNKPYGMSSDVYSLGLVLYWLLNERRMPFLPLPPAVPVHTEEENAKNRRFAGEPLPPPAHGRQALKDIVLKACAFDQANRYHTAAQLRADLEALPKAAIVLPPQPAPEKESQTCLHCGQPLLPNANFCKYCGKESTAKSATPIPAKINPPIKPLPKPPVPAGSSAGSSGKQAPLSNTPEEEKKKKHFLPIILGIVAILCVAGILITLFPAANNAPTDWSQWTDTLPDSVSSEDYTIEEQTLYRTRSLETTTSDSSTMDGWELAITTDGEEQLGQWSDWSEEKPEPSDTLEVEEQTRYRYREKETTTESSSTKEGWTLDSNATTYEWGNYGSWSSWSTTPAYDSDSRDATSKTQYRYRTLNYTQSTSSSLSGWTRYDSSTSYGSWGNWSSWSSNYVGSSDTRQVETRYVEPTYRTEYNYTRYTQYNTATTGRAGWSGPTKGYWSGIYCQYYQERGWSTTRLSYCWSDSGHGVYGYDGYYWYDEQSRQVEVTPGYTEYCYRDRTKTTTYYYHQWGSWSGWGDTYYSESSTRDVESRTLYCYRDRPSIPTYHFWRWKDWVDWSETKPTEAANRETEEKLFYRTRSHTPTKIYHFRRWSAWSDYSTQPAEASDTLQVETMTQYRYKRK